MGSGVAVYHLAMGTENLFAREFGMDRLPETLERAMAGGRVVEVDGGWVRVGIGDQGSPFVLMCSMGPDASVIRRLDERRDGPISHLTYVRPVAAEVLGPWLPRVTVEVDGEKVVEGRKGMVVVANSRQYALRIDPAHRASMSDGLLDVVFFPAGSGVSAFVALVRSKLRRHSRSVVYRQGREVRVCAEESKRPALQIDGECRRVSPGALEIWAEVRARALRVLVP
jgi:diacylglycerol kinase family enzyme